MSYELYPADEKVSSGLILPQLGGFRRKMLIKDLLTFISFWSPEMSESNNIAPIPNQEEELECLKAIYCKPEEFSSWESPEGHYVVIRFDFNLPHKDETLMGGLHLLLPPDYPMFCPKEMIVFCDHLPLPTLQSMKIKVEEKAESLKGEPMLLELVCFLQELFQSSVINADISTSVTLHTSECVASISNSLEQKSAFSIKTFTTDKVNTLSLSSTEEHRISKDKSQCEGDNINHIEEKNLNETFKVTALLQLDHMRSKQSYIKLIRKWTAELGLTGRLLFYGKFIFIILQGHNESIKEYIVRNRTMTVDVDSKGRPCKERMLKVLCENPSESFQIIQEFEVVDNIPSIEEFQSFLESFSMMDMFKAYIEPLCSVKSKKSSLKR